MDHHLKDGSVLSVVIRTYFTSYFLLITETMRQWSPATIRRTRELLINSVPLNSESLFYFMYFWDPSQTIDILYNAVSNTHMTQVYLKDRQNCATISVSSRTKNNVRLLIRCEVDDTKSPSSAMGFIKIGFKNVYLK